jgi:hypothetical protein
MIDVVDPDLKNRPVQYLQIALIAWVVISLVPVSVEDCPVDYQTIRERSYRVENCYLQGVVLGDEAIEVEVVKL